MCLKSEVKIETGFVGLDLFLQFINIIFQNLKN